MVWVCKRACVESLVELVFNPVGGLAQCVTDEKSQKGGGVKCFIKGVSPFA